MKTSKRLINKAKKALLALDTIRECNGTRDPQFDAQDPRTKENYSKALRELKTFIDNIDYFN